MNRTPPQLVFARVLSTMMHPGPLSVLGLVLFWAAMSQRDERER
jgi:hypothetical protein